MILLDTNVISALMRERPDLEVVRWLDRQPRSSVWTTSITVFEIRFGLQTMAEGKRQRSLMKALDRMLSEILEGRIAVFDGVAAEEAAVLAAKREQAGRPGEFRDTMIAGIVLAHRGTLATRNVRHFDDIAGMVVNPWE